MNDKPNVKREFADLCFELDRQVITEMSRNNMEVGLNNVIVGIREECFGLLLSDDEHDVAYQLFYVNGKGELSGFLLNLSIGDDSRDDLVFMFATHLAFKFKHLDVIDVFNTFQEQTREMLEKVGFFTVSSLEMERFYGKNPTLITKGGRGAMMLPLIDKVKFFQEYFGNRHAAPWVENRNYVYLMLNTRNGLIKIGTSKKPQIRERTLQSQEPEIFLLAFWQAPKEVERELHKKFYSKRKRGEWFNLKSKEMKEINDRMSEFE